MNWRVSVIICTAAFGFMTPAFSFAQDDGLKGFAGASRLRTLMSRTRQKVRTDATREVESAGDTAADTAIDSTGPTTDADASTTLRALMDVNRLMSPAPAGGVPAIDGPGGETTPAAQFSDDLLKAWAEGSLRQDNVSSWLTTDSGSALRAAAANVRKKAKNEALDGDPTADTTAAESKAAAEFKTNINQKVADAVFALDSRAGVAARDEAYRLAAAGILDVRVDTNETDSRKFIGVNRLLPTPVESNNLFVDRFDSTKMQLGRAEMLFADSEEEAASEDVATRFMAMAHFGMLYNTSAVAGGSNFSPAAVDLDGNDVLGAGQTTFFSNSKNPSEELILPYSVGVDNQIIDFLGFDTQVEFYAEGDNFLESDSFELDDFYVRGWDHGQWSVTVGMTDSIFEVGGRMLPSGLIGQRTLIGSSSLRNSTEKGMSNNRTQVRLQNKTAEGIEWAIAIEDPIEGQFDVPSGTEITRWPALTSRLLWVAEDQDCKLTAQFSGLVRSQGFETTALTTHSDIAWGLAAYLALDDKTTGAHWYAGVAGGEGIGGYIRGVSVAAAGDGTTSRFESVGGLGAYIGLKQDFELPYGQCNESVACSSNFAYGYAQTENHSALDQTMTNQNVHHGWCNVIALLSPNFAVGAEYQYGAREVFDGNRGENHQFMLIFALKGNPSGDAAQDAADEQQKVRYVADELALDDASTEQMLQVESYRPSAYQQGL